MKERRDRLKMSETDKAPKDGTGGGIKRKVLKGRMGIELRACMDPFSVERENLISLKYRKRTEMSSGFK